MNYKKSHRDQKVRPYVIKAIESGCNILEIDIQQAMGKIVLGHNWRPKFKFLFDCTLKQYMGRVPGNIYVQLDIKEICFTPWGKRKFAAAITKELNSYRHITFLLSANNGLDRPETMHYVYIWMTVAGYRVYAWRDFKANNQIEVIDLW